jgi:molybdenum cofactor cytidylyltransferase
VKGAIKVGAVILAAGSSRRMGSNKLCALLDGKPVIAHVADMVLAAGLPAVIVVGHEADAVMESLGARTILSVVAPDHAAGQAHSLAAGVRAIPADWDAAFICLGDMPLVPAELLRKMAQAASTRTIIVPHFNGRRGNPVLWGRRWFDALQTLTGDKGARDLLLHHRADVTEFAWRDDSIHHDADTPEALAAMRDQCRVAKDESAN